MILAVVGSTKFSNKYLLFQEIDKLRKRYNITGIVTGDAYGADAFGREYAKKHKLKLIVHEAQWQDFGEPCVIKTNSKNIKYNALAGFKRNTWIVDDCNIMIAMWVKKSPGTRDSINKAKKQGKEVFVFEF